MKYGNVEIPDYDPVAEKRRNDGLQIVTFAAPPARTCKESTLQTLCEDALFWCGWRYFHDPDAHATTDARTGALRHDDSRKRGFPDLICIKPPRIIFFELKATRGTLRPDQEWWRDDLIASGQEWHLIKPDDWLKFLWLIVPPHIETISTGPYDYAKGDDIVRRR